MSRQTAGYQYIVLRCVPSVLREEFVNVGVVLYSQHARFLKVAYSLDRARLQAFSPDLDVDALERALRETARLCDGSGTFAQPDLPRLGPLFGWLSAPRSTVVQPGPVHGGVTADPAAELQRLLSVLVASTPA